MEKIIFNAEDSADSIIFDEPDEYGNIKVSVIEKFPISGPFATSYKMAPEEVIQLREALINWTTSPMERLLKDPNVSVKFMTMDMGNMRLTLPAKYPTDERIRKEMEQLDS